MLTGCQVGAQHSLGCARDKAAPLQEPADALWRIPIDLAAGLGLRFPPNVTAPRCLATKKAGRNGLRAPSGSTVSIHRRRRSNRDRIRYKAWRQDQRRDNRRLLLPTPP